MNFEFNKVAGAVLGTALGVMVVGIVAEAIYEPRVSEQPGFVIAVAEPGEGGGGETPAEPQVEPIANRLQVASVEDGAGDVAKCKTCHTFEQGGPNKVGPNLWDVVGHNVIHAEFDYSDAMRAAGEAGMEWTFENLDHFIENPKKFIPGTAMSFAGVKDPEQRADIIAYLRTLSDNPVPLPEPVAATPEAGAETPPAAGENPPAATESPPAEQPAAPPAEEPAAPPTTEEPAPAPEPATPPATEAPAPAPEPATPPAAEPAPAPEPTVPPAMAPEETVPPAMAPEETVPPAMAPEPTPETTAPAAPEPTAPAGDQPASSGQTDGAAPAPEAAPEPTMAPAPDAEADSPEGAPASETPAQ